MLKSEAKKKRAGLEESDCSKEAKDPQEGGSGTETGLWPQLIPLEYQTYPAANK